MCRHACQPTRARREPGQVDLGRVPLTMRAVRPSPSLHRLEPPSCRSTACGTSAGQPSRLMVLLATMAVVACVQCTATIRTVPVLPDPAARRIPTPPRACPARSGAWRHGPGRAHPALPACRSAPVRRGAIRRRMPSRRHRRSKGLPAARWRPRGHARPPHRASSGPTHAAMPHRATERATGRPGARSKTNATMAGASSTARSRAVDVAKVTRAPTTRPCSQARERWRPSGAAARGGSRVRLPMRVSPVPRARARRQAQ